MFQPSLLTDVQREERPHKRQRKVAREIYRRQRTEDAVKAEQGRETRQGQVLRCLSHFWNRRQYSPTALELLAFMQANGERVRDANDVRPKLFYLEQKGLVEKAGERACRVTGQVVMTWRVKEAGSGGKTC